jgi:hypothetical protein
MVEVAAKEQ